MQKEEVILDAEKKSLGRLATEIAYYLQGKHLPDYDPSQDKKVFVLVKNLDKVKFTGKKMETKIYYWHTGYVGHLKSLKLKELWAKNPVKVLKLAVSRMLPKNRLRQRRLLRIKVIK